MRNKGSLLLAWIFFPVALESHYSAHAQTRIAHSSQGFTSFQYAVINNAGVVCFSATKINGAGHVVKGVYKGSGGGVTTVLETEIPAPAGQPVPFGNQLIAMNDGGLVALVASGFDPCCPNQLFVYATRGTVTQPNNWVPAYTPLSGQFSFSINNNNLLSIGSVYQLDSNGNHIFIAPDALLFDPCRNCFGLLNNHDQLLRSMLDSVTGDTRISRVSVGIVAVNPFSGIKILGPTGTNEIISIHTPTGGLNAMNDSGTVAYLGVETNGVTAIFKTSGGAGTPFVEFQNPNAPPGTGPDLSQVGDNSFAINNSGQVAFLARSRLLGKTAIFRGPNALTDKIVASGDIVAVSRIELFGSGGLFGNGHWFNDGGQVVFKAEDDTGLGLWMTGNVASPPPKNPTPSSRFEWNPVSKPPPTPPNGSFTNKSNWVPLDGTTNRVPEKTSTHADIAIFDRAEQYTVELGIQHDEQMIVKNGNVTFQNGSIRVDALSFDNPSAIIDNARLTLSGPNAPVISPMLICNHTLVGASGAARVDVAGAEWDCLGSLRIGGPGDGILTIDSFGIVTSGEARIGTGVGGGKATVGTNGTWRTGNIAIGAGGKGELTIQNGGRVDSSAASIGHDPGSGGGFPNSVLVQGKDDTSPSRWNVVTLSVGDASKGRLDITGGGFVESVVEHIAQKTGATGYVTVSGVGTDSATRSRHGTVELYMGEGHLGLASLRIEDGGLFSATRVFLGEGTGDSMVTVTGIHAATGTKSELDVSEVLRVGNFNSAILQIESGGIVHSGSGQVLGSFFGPPTASQVFIESGSIWLLDDQLTVGSQGSMGAAVVTLTGGKIEAASVEVNQKGTIQGSGTLGVPTANRVVNGGTISPGLSPGTLTINGNYEQPAEGRLLIEIGSTNSPDYDHLVVTDAATLGGNVTFKFINGFAPKAGDHFDFLSVGGALSNTFATVAWQNLAPGFQFNFVTNGPLLSMGALNDGVFDPRLPGQVDVTLTNVGGLTYATYVLTTSNTCQRITLDGALTQTSNVFSQALQGTTFIGGGCTDKTDSVTNTILLGTLAPGDYSFRILANTQAVQTVAFTVPPNPGKTLLAPTRLPDGSVQFQIDGLSPTHYTIEASEDLQNWIELGGGTLPDAFIDPDAAIFPTRYYRAVIGQ